MEGEGHGDGRRDNFDNLINSMKGSPDSQYKPSLLKGAASEAVSSQALGQRAMDEVMDKAAADRKAALKGDVPGLRGRLK